MSAPIHHCAPWFLPLALALLLAAVVLPLHFGCRAAGLPAPGEAQRRATRGPFLDLIELERLGGPGDADREEVYRRRLAAAESVIHACEFEGPGGTEGWRPAHDCRDLRVEGGALRLRSTGNDCQLSTRPDFDCRPVRRLVVRLRVSAGEQGKLYWASPGDPGFSEERSADFRLRPGEDGQTCRLELGDHPLWGGPVDRLRLDPTDAPADVEIDSLTFQSGLSSGEADLLRVECGLPGASLELAGDRRPALLASPGEPKTFSLVLPGPPAQPVLRFAAGLPRPGGAEGGAPLRFLVRARAGGWGGEEVLGEERLDPASRPADRAWREGEVPLAGLAGRRIELTLEVVAEGPGPAASPTAAWANPLVDLGGEPGPNVLLVVVDALRADHLGAYGCARRLTPSLDRWGRRGILFREALSPSSWTSPVIASLFTGLLPYRHGVRFADSLDLDRGLQTLAERFREAGRFTGGFSDNLIIVPAHGYDQGFRTFLSKSPGFHEPKSRSMTRLALSWLERHGRRPFFLYLHYMNPHADYQPPPPFHPGPAAGGEPIRPLVEQGKAGDVTNRMRRDPRFRLTAAEQRRFLDLYAGEVASADYQVGRLLGWMEEAGLLETTVVAFLADHGEEFDDHGKYSHATSLHDELVRVPLFILAPPAAGIVPPRVAKTGVRVVDIAPTLLDLAGAGGLGGGRDGASFLPLLRGEARPGGEAEAFAELNPHTHAPLAPGWVEAARMLRLEGMKLLYYPRTGSLRLYDLAADPGERHDLYRPDDPRAKELASRLACHLAAEAAAAAERPGGPPPLSEADLRRLETLGYLER